MTIEKNLDTGETQFSNVSLLPLVTNYGNGFAGTWVGNQSDRDNGVSGSSGNSTQLRRLPSELLSPSQLNSCLPGHVFEDLNNLLGISVGGAKYLYDVLDTGTKSNLVYNFSKSLKYNTGIQVKTIGIFIEMLFPKISNGQGER